MRFCGGLTPLKKSENGNSNFVEGVGANACLRLRHGNSKD